MAAARTHTHHLTLTWSGNLGTGTSAYTHYSRAHDITAAGKPPIPGSSDPAFRGDPARWNPEELLLAAVAACHQLWFLHLAADAGLIVHTYTDHAEATLLETPAGGHIQSATLHPETEIEGDPATAAEIHETAHARCFIANSVRFPITCRPIIRSRNN